MGDPGLTAIFAILWRGRIIRTGIYKYPITGVVGVSRTGLVGDQQADLTVHGGDDKAIHAYSLQDYGHWSRVEDL